MKVSPLCLGAMMFGAWGEPDHDVSIKIINRALDAGINFIDTADVYSAGRVGGDRRQGACRGRRDDVVLATKVHGQMGVQSVNRATPTSVATRAAGSSARSRTACAGCRPTGSTCTRFIVQTQRPTSRRRLAR